MGEAGSQMALPGDYGAFRALCGEAIPKVYGFVLHRCGDAGLAEDLTSDTLLAAAVRYREGTAEAVTMPWLMTVARNKLIDHWRRAEREQRRLRLVWRASGDEAELPEWEGDASHVLALAVLGDMAPAYQAVLTLRYLDGLGVPDVARSLSRSVHATESLLARAKTAFRRAYLERADD
jgi:RNA polymerase sigma-70 factor (ECF subfamily)